MGEEREADEIMAVLQAVLVAIDNALLRGSMPDRTVKQLEVASENLKAIGVRYPIPTDSRPCPECGHEEKVR